MGIRGLQTYLKCHCPDACYTVNVPSLISQERRRTGCRPTIVVDSPSCFSMWCRGLDWTIGLEVNELIGRLRSFVDAFNDMGADLVFYVGSWTPLKKRKTWLSRRISSLNKMMNVSDMLYAGKTYEDIPEALDSIPPNMGNFVTFVLKHVLNCTVYVAVRDCDDEIINHVKENDCFAIFAYDSDFIVSQVKCKVLCAKRYDSDLNTTLLYDREELSQYLNIAENQLPLLAILAGNDLVNFEVLRPFHYRICNWPPKKEHIPYKILMESIATYINDLPCWRSIRRLMFKICKDVFGYYSNDKVDEMMRAYYSYIPSPTSEFILDDGWSRVRRAAKSRLQNVLLPPSAWNVLCKQTYESSVFLEDMRKINNSNADVKELPCATITRDLRRRFYGVLLFENRNTNPVVEEWCAENRGSYVNPVRVTPEYPKVHHPGLRALWDAERADTHYQNKWKLFLGAISPKIVNIGDWMTLPDELVVGAAACYYLFFEKRFLTRKEARAVLITLVMFSSHPRSNLNKLRQIRHHFQSVRAIQIVVTFSRTFSIVFSLLASCGFPVPLSEEEELFNQQQRTREMMREELAAYDRERQIRKDERRRIRLEEERNNTAHIKFEPVLFHSIYKNVQDEDDLKQLCQNNYKAIKLFNRMKKVLNGQNCGEIF